MAQRVTLTGAAHGAATAIGAGIDWPAVRAAVAGAAKGLDLAAEYEMRYWQFTYHPKINAEFAQRPGYWRAAFAVPLAMLRAHGPTVRLYRGQPHAVETRITRAFLSWTEYRPEAEEYAAGGVLRVADVPLTRILAIMPHGKGMEWFVTPGLIPGERREIGAVCGYISIDPSVPGELDWAPGTAEKRRVASAIAYVGGTVVLWKPRRDDDDDYWSGYAPLPDHGSFWVRLPTAALDRLRALRVEFNPWGCGRSPFRRES